MGRHCHRHRPRLPDDAWSLRLRIPSWSDVIGVHVNGEPTEGRVQQGWLDIERPWTADDQVVLELSMTPRFTAADHRVDSARGAVAIERGPLVYCLESVDHPDLRLDDVRLDLNAPAVPGGVVLDKIPTVQVAATRVSVDRGSWWPYREATADTRPDTGRVQQLTAIPYFAWGNRGPGAMRIWTPAG